MIKKPSAQWITCIIGTFIFLCIQCTKKEEKVNILFVLADDWSYPYAGIYGNKELKTPNLDAIASKGTVFTHAFCSAPSCTPSRASILTGNYPHTLGEGANLVGRLDVSIPTYVKDLRKAGYKVAYDRKGWAPGDYEKMGYTQNPCGDLMAFDSLLNTLGKNQPFFFWWGTQDPHRNFDLHSGASAGKNVDSITVPGFLPNVPEIRGDIADYLTEIERLDKEVGELLNKLEKANRLKNTVIIITSDNGMPFPHAKANLYDYGTRVPLIVTDFRKPQDQFIMNHSFVNLIDLTATFYDLAEIMAKPKMNSISLLPVINKQTNVHRSEVFLERERHCMCRAEMNYHAGYPMRAIRTQNYLYIRNFRPHRWPAGDETIPGTPSIFGDTDGGPTKIYMMDHRNQENVKDLFQLGFGLRPAEELYDVNKDPFQIHNMAADTSMISIKESLSAKLNTWMVETNDPRVNPSSDIIDSYVPTTRAWITRDGIVLLDGK